VGVGGPVGVGVTVGPDLGPIGPPTNGGLWAVPPVNYIHNRWKV
jgi:hypothetical protein